jgi:flagellar hook-length control protein FliK
MMQHIATAKSEVAAFATGGQTNSFSGSESNEQFGKLLQDQKSIHSTANASDKESAQTLSKKPMQSSTDELNKTAAKVQEDNTKQVESTSNSNSNTSNLQSSNNVNSADNSVDGHVEKNNGTVTISADEKLNDELAVADAKAMMQSASSSKQADTNSSIIVAQEWVELVESLQKLADIARSTQQNKIGEEVQDVPTSDLKVSINADKSLLEKIVDSQKVDKINMTTDQINLQIKDTKEGLNLTQDEIVLVDKEQLSLSISLLITETLKSAKNKGVTDINVKHVTAELLLEQPEILQDLINQLNLASQKNGTDITEQINTNTAMDNVIKNDLLQIKQQLDDSSLTDLTLAENKALLRNLLINSETEITGMQESNMSDKIGLSEAPEQLVQAQYAQTLIAPLEPVAEPGELLEQVTSNNDIKNILNLTNNQLQKVLENIAQRVFDTKKASESISSEQILQQVVIPKTAEMVSSIESSSKELISALKSGLEEFKNQLSQGREPGIDLKALLSDALAKTGETGAVTKTPVNLEQMLKNVNQVIDFAQTVNRAIEHHHEQNYSAALRDVAQIQGEQSKQTQLNQFESKFEKAINITKPEGHQLLAEKVRWMVNTKNLVAEIRLDPAELGSVHVKVAMSGESASVNFVVQSQLARDAVDNASPRLREMLAEKGIELGQSSVRQESDGQQSQGDSQDGSGNDEAEDADVTGQVLAQQNIVNGALGGIDYFV